MRKFVFLLVVGVGLSVLWSLLFPVKAFYDFMAPGVPPQAMCKELNIDQKLQLSLKPSKLSIKVGEPSRVDLILKNIGKDRVQVSYLDVSVTYPPDLVKITSIKVDPQRICGVDSNESFIDNTKGVFRLLVDQTKQESCEPVVVGPEEEVILARADFIGLSPGVANFEIVTKQTGDYQPVFAYSFENPNQNLVVEVKNASVSIGTLTSTPITTNTPTPTPTPRPSQPPSTGILEIPAGVVSLLLILGALIYYWHSEPFDDTIILD